MTRPATLLERALRCPGYHQAGLKNVISISERGLCKIYVVEDEWQSLEKWRVKSLLLGGGSRKIHKFEYLVEDGRKFVESFKKESLSPAMTKSLFNYYAKITEIIIYTHLLEKSVDTESKLARYRKKVGFLHNEGRRVIDMFYDVYLTKTGNPSFGWQTPQEIIGKKNVTKKVLNNRKKYYVLFSQPRLFRLWTGSRAMELARKIEKIVSSSEKGVLADTVRGTPAYRAKVQGRVLVLNHILDLNKIRSGVILVSAMTEPRMNPYLKNAKAIITDEGGLTSHAAIIARELRKPCIVGTKIATKVFRDGDLVEVDANKGVVRKLT